ncbi:MAG: penicillin-binding protein 2 [Acidobacteria bacterium]|nr:penicillin-binding protein 2 [Acidobacteriota bacterium]
MAKFFNDNRHLLARLNGLQYALVVVFAVLAVRLWHLQILQYQEHLRQAERNRIRAVQLVAPRGLITDREGRVLADNRPSFNLFLDREEMKDQQETVRFLQVELGLERRQIESQLKKFETTPPFQPIVMKEDLSLAEIAVVESRQLEHPELRILQEPRRHYPYGELAAHPLGYVGEATQEQLKTKEFSQTRSGDLVGKYGVERTYNAVLTGKDGQEQVMVTSAGRVIQALDRRDPVIGREVRLTLDLDLQKAAEEMMAGKRGAVVVLDPNNGDVLVLLSKPSFNPNDFARRISRQLWQELINNPDHPFQNRGLSSNFPPGSVFKVFMTYAGLEEQTVDEKSYVRCSGGIPMYGRFFHCWKKGGHGFVTLPNAIINSCNVFFYTLGYKLGIERIAHYAKASGLGVPTGIDLHGEASGVVPSPEWKMATFGDKWYAGETISVSIGQGAVSTTPLQLARAFGGLVTGRLSRPHVLMEDPVNDFRKAGRRETPAIPIQEKNMEILKNGLAGVVTSGTGRQAAVPGVEVGGKTGTAQVIGRENLAKVKNGTFDPEDNAWFVGFAPKQAPEIVVVVFVEHGGHGGSAAAPVAGRILKEYFDKKQHQKERPLIALRTGSDESTW